MIFSYKNHTTKRIRMKDLVPGVWYKVVPFKLDCRLVSLVNWVAKDVFRCMSPHITVARDCKAEESTSLTYLNAPSSIYGNTPGDSNLLRQGFPEYIEVIDELHI